MCVGCPFSNLTKYGDRPHTGCITQGNVRFVKVNPSWKGPEVADEVLQDSLKAKE
jgi:hypothetical protein